MPTPRPTPVTRASQAQFVRVAAPVVGAGVEHATDIVARLLERDVAGDLEVLSAIEGLETATPGLTPYVVPISVLVLVGLFLLQSAGTARVGAMFGPVMLLWFVSIGFLGARWIVGNPAVLEAVNPAHAWTFFAENR